ncbi:hypothetical protein SUGI_0355700 [Cryptomeria japonica]|nr:hypothetical protein SUGI_0355700 [Cryptomeria japonica]
MIGNHSSFCDSNCLLSSFSKLVARNLLSWHFRSAQEALVLGMSAIRCTYERFGNRGSQSTTSPLVVRQSARAQEERAQHRGKGHNNTMDEGKTLPDSNCPSCQNDSPCLLR